MRPVDIIRIVCQRARTEYLSAFEASDDRLAEAGITNSPERLADFLATCCHETDGLTITEEDGNYSASRMMQVWPSRFPTRESADPFAHNPEALFNKVYGGRMGNGPSGTGDGFKYRGRGLFQTTGKDAYSEWGRKLGVDLVSQPELILSEKYALAPAIYEWSSGNCNSYADRGDFLSTQKIINMGSAKKSGPPVGWASRCAWRNRILAAMDGKTIDKPTKPPITASMAENPISVKSGAIAAAALAVAPVVQGSTNVVSYPVISAVAAAVLAVSIAYVAFKHFHSSVGG